MKANKIVIICATLLFACEGTLASSSDPLTKPEVNNGSVVNPNNGIGEPNNGGTVDESLLARPTGRRLSPYEAASSAQAIMNELGVNADLTAIPLPPPSVRVSFSNRAENGNLTYDQVVNLVGWAEALSLNVVEQPASIGCVPTSTWDSCAQDFATRLARLAWRRPPTTTENERFEEIFSTVVADATTTPLDGVRAMFEFAMISPDFWYLSSAVAEDGERFDSHAIAARLSYFLWGTMPDASLRELADQDALSTAEEIRTQVDTMLKDPRAETIVARFHREWLHTQAAYDLQKDGVLYPTFNEEMASDLETEFDAFVNELVLRQGTIDDMFASSFGFVNQRLESLYGLPSQASGNDDWIWRDLGDTRAGIFTRPLFLASTAGAGESQLIHRGTAVVEQALCWHLEVPDNVADEAVEIPPDASSGKLLGVENRASKAQCSRCHDVIDPIGLAFEAFDAVGVDRLAYPDGVVMETFGTINVGTNVEYADAAELMKKLAVIDDVKSCYASKWVEWTTGYPVDPESAIERDNIRNLGQVETIRDLIIEIASSDQFRKRQEISQ